jgi:hypothetical protein
MKTQFEYYKHGAPEKVAEWVAEQSHSQFVQEQKIAPVEPEDIYKNYAGVVAVQGIAIVGYVGAKQPVWIEEHGRSLSQISSLIVHREHQKQGVASGLVRAITREIAEDRLTPFAFSGPASQSVFKQANYEPVRGDVSLPAGVVSMFGNPALMYRGPLGFAHGCVRQM